MADSLLESILATLPSELSARVADLCASQNNKDTLENLLRFALGSDCTLSSLTQDWSEKQAKARAILEGIVPLSSNTSKRTRDDDGGASIGHSSKRPKIQLGGTDAASDHSGNPSFILHSISATSPVRKKVDIKIYHSAIVFENPGTGAVEAEIPTKYLTRAFLLPTRGKSKAHWTVVILSADSPSTGKAASNDPSNQQIIFGIDAKSTAALSTSTFSPDPVKESHPKGSDTLPILRKFLSNLPFPVLEPSIQVFRSSIGGPGPSGNGVPGIEAYRGAKAGSLWFMKEGVLWGESKPCEFWSVEDLINRTEGLRVVGGTGKTCSVVLTRRPPKPENHKEGTGDSEEPQVEGEETQFGVIDAKEQDPVNEWVRKHRHLFGTVDGQPPPSPPATKPGDKPIPSGKITLSSAHFDDSDESDSSFDDDSGDSDGSGSSSDNDSGEEDAEESRSVASSQQDDEEAEGDVDMESEGELDPAKHPLLRPGAVPKMNRAAMDMAIQMVNTDLMGNESGGEDELDE